MTENTIILQSQNLLDLAAPMIESVSKKIDKLFTEEEFRSFKKVILTGCGDSYIAGPAALGAFEAISGVRCKALFTVDATYHLPEDLCTTSTYKTLAIGTSVSGSAGGTVKSIINLKRLGCTTLALTENVNSPLAQKSDRILNLDPTDFSITPGTKTYFCSVISLILVAIKFGLVNGVITEAQAAEIKQDIIDYAEAFKKEIKGINKQTAKIAKAFKKCKHMEFVGTGLDYATAWFGRAKVYEAFGWVCTAENSEDWMHVNYFARRPKELACVAIMSSGNPSNSRLLENIQTMELMGRPTMIITDVDGEYPDDMFVVKIPSAKKAYIAPLLQILPITILCGHMAEELKVPFFRGFVDPWRTAGSSIRYVEGEV